MKNNLSENESKVLEHLKEYPLTTLQAVTNLHIMNVQDVIMRLKDYGYNILKEWKKSGNKRYAEYKLVR
jgi:hypothetical protein